MRQLGTRALRIAAAAGLVWCIGAALIAPELPLLTRLGAVVIAVVTLWQPAHGVVAVAALAPAGTMLAPAPARGADLLAWAFLAAWLLRVWRPLAAKGVPRGVMLPALLYAACAVVSWLALTIAGAAGVGPSTLVFHLANTISAEFLVFSAPDAETWAALQTVTGIAVFVAAAAVARAAPAVTRRTAWALAGSLAVLAVLTCVDVWRQWGDANYDVNYLLRYTRGERFALHLDDVNAAASQYVLAAGVALGLVLAERGRQERSWPAVVGGVVLLLTLPAFWLTGSRSGIAGLAGGAAALAAARRARQWRISRTQALVAGGVLALVLVAVAAVAVFGGNERGSAGRALRLRTQFLETSAKMIVAEPVFGVGVGRYFSRSPEFMPAPLRDLYGAENAHNYFAQQAAELGLLGGGLFMWLIAAASVCGWRAARGGGPGSALVPLFAGCVGYLLTAVTGHPFLVSAAALPFWIALGVLATGAPRRETAMSPHPRAAASIAAVLFVVSAVQSVIAWRGAEATPAERGFDRAGVSDEGRRFRWTTSHVVTYIPDGAGFLRMTVRAPDREFTRPVTVETAVAGRVVDRRTLPRGEWVTADIPVRLATDLAFRRVDLRVTPTWSEPRAMARRTAPISVSLGVMVAELRWVRPGAR